MKAFTTLAALVALVAQASALTINTPASIVQCEPIQFTWTSDGTPPYFLTLLPGGQPSAAPLKSFPQTSATSFTWLADLPAGVQITAALRDSTGNQVFTQAVTIQSGPDSSCINTTVNESATGSSGATAGSPAATTTPGAAGASGGATSAPGSSAPAAGSTSGSGSKPSSTTGTTKPSGSTTASGSGSSNAATSRGASAGTLGLAGLMGLVGAALL